MPFAPRCIHNETGVRLPADQLDAPIGSPRQRLPATAVPAPPVAPGRQDGPVQLDRQQHGPMVSGGRDELGGTLWSYRFEVGGHHHGAFAVACVVVGAGIEE